MRIAYLISAHTDPQQLLRLIEALGSEAHSFVHIDKKSSLERFTSLIKSDRVHFLRERIDVRWGTINEWYYQRLLLEAAVTYPLYFDRLVTLSGLDYPLWSNRRIEAYFEQHKGEEQLAAMPLMETVHGKDIFRELRLYLTLPLIGSKGNQRLSILVRKAAKALGYKRAYTFRVGGEEWREYKGAAWWAISQELAEHVLDTYEHYRKEILRQFRNQHCPAETLLPTIAFNSPQWRERCKLFPPETTLKEKTLLHHIQYAAAIKVWTLDDYEELKASGKMFARKLTTEASLPLMEVIDKDRT